MITYLIISLVTYIFLITNKNISIDIADSYLLENQDTYKTNAILFALLFPITIFFLIKNKQMKNLKKIVIFSVLLLILYSVITSLTGSYNSSVDTLANFKQHQSQRGATFDKMKKTMSEKMQIAGLNDTSYSKIALAIASNRKDGEGLLWKWAHEQNPNINYSEVSALYKDLSSSVSELRIELQQTENLLQADTREWYVMHHRFPNNVFLFYQIGSLEYSPILSDESRNVNTTGVDNSYKIKL